MGFGAQKTITSYSFDCCWLGDRRGIRSVKKYCEDGGGGHWLVRMEWRPAGWSGGWSVCLPLLIFLCTMKSRSSLLAPAHPGGPRKRAIKRLWWYIDRPRLVWRSYSTYSSHLGVVISFTLFLTVTYRQRDPCRYVTIRRNLKTAWLRLSRIFC